MEPVQIARLISEDTNFHGGIIAEEDVRDYDVLSVPPQVLADMVEENGGKPDDLQHIIRAYFSSAYDAFDATYELGASIRGYDDEYLVRLSQLMYSYSMYIPGEKRFTNFDHAWDLCNDIANMTERICSDKMRVVTRDLITLLQETIATINSAQVALNANMLTNVSKTAAAGAKAAKELARQLFSTRQYILPRIIWKSNKTTASESIVNEEDVRKHDVFSVPIEVLADMIEEDGGKASDFAYVVEQYYNHFWPIFKRASLLGERIVNDILPTIAFHNTERFEPVYHTANSLMSCAYAKLNSATYRELAKSVSNSASIYEKIFNNLQQYLPDIQDSVIHGNTDTKRLFDETIKSSRVFSLAMRKIVDHIIPRITDWYN